MDLSLLTIKSIFKQFSLKTIGHIPLNAENLPTKTGEVFAGERCLRK